MITLSKIAKLAHVSVSTASKAFSMSGDVSEKTRQEIFQIAKEYGCFKKFYAAKYPKYVIAVLCPEFHSQHYATMIASLQEALRQRNCEVCMASTDFSPETEASLLEYYLDYANVDGIILIGSRVQIPSPCELPVVSITPACQQEANITITTGCKDALSQAIDHLLARNITDIVFVGEQLTDGKMERYLSLTAQKELPSDHLIISHERFEIAGYLAMEQLFTRKKLPQAVICAYDNMAIGAMRSISEHGLSIPDDICIMGMDNIPVAEFLSPSLSSIDFQTEQTCQVAADSMIQLLTGQQVQTSLLIPATLMLRESL